MSVLRRLFTRDQPDPHDEQRDGLFTVLQSPLGGGGLGWATHSGQAVTLESALRSAAVAACVRVLKSSVAQLPVDVVRVQGKRRIPVQAPPVVRFPSGTVSQRGWVAQLLHAQLTAGNAYAMVTAVDPNGNPLTTETINPGDVSWQKDERDGLVRPWVNGERRNLYPLGDIVHIPATSFLTAGSPVAQSPVELAKQSIGTALAAEEFGARFFGDGFHPSVLAKVNREITNDQAQAIKDRIAAMRTTREPAVFGSGIELEEWPIEPKSTQFIDLLQFEVLQACRFFGVPPRMVYAAVSGQNVTYANVGQDDMQFLKHSLSIWLLDIEDAWTSLLGAPQQQVKFNVDAMLRMDAKERHNLYTVRLHSKTMTVNEVRELEDEEPFDDPLFDEPGIPGGAAQNPVDLDHDGIVDPQPDPEESDG